MSVTVTVLGILGDTQEDGRCRNVLLRSLCSSTNLLLLSIYLIHVKDTKDKTACGGATVKQFIVLRFRNPGGSNFFQTSHFDSGCQIFAPRWCGQHQRGV